MLVALASATAIAILLTAGPDDGCPSPRQVSDAVSAHLPGVVLPLGRAPGPSALRLSVTTDGAGTLRVDLSDPDGGALLRRRVAPESAARTKAAECVALAETAALIVDRYWHEVGYEVPPAPAAVPAKPRPPNPPAAAKPVAVPPPPPPPEPPAAVAEPEVVERAVPERPPERPRGPPHPPDWWLAARISGGSGDTGLLHGAASLAGAVERAALGHRLGLRLSVSGRYPNEVAWTQTKNVPVVPAGRATITQVSVAMDVYLAFPVGFGRLEPGLGGDLNVISVTSTQGTATDSSVRLAPAVDALLAWTIPFPHDIFLRGMAAGAVAVPYRMFNDAIKQDIFKTPRLRAELGLQLGVSFY
ncbi:MAG TPA: hypothetical protein VLT58_08975 [Polyangia bacterium]|nr:hypothetical protein [Polyangia bacterium]